MMPDALADMNQNTTHRDFSAMSYYQYDGPGGEFAQRHGFSQAVILPSSPKIVITAGQAGIDLKTGKVVTTSAEAQISAAFDCVEAALKKAGVGKGLLAVHKFLTFMLDTDLEPVMMPGASSYVDLCWVVKTVLSGDDSGDPSRSNLIIIIKKADP